ENSTAAVYREYADDVVLRSAFKSAFSYVRPQRRIFGRAIPLAPAKPQPSPIKSLATPAAQTSTQLSAMNLAADRVVAAAKGALGAQLSRQSVIRALQGVPGLTTAGAASWLNHGSYKGLLLAIAKRRRGELRLYTYRNGGVCVAYLSPDGA